MGCYNSTIVNASADKVWETIKNFHDASWSANVVTKLDIVGDKKGNEPGAKRVLNDAFQETLISVNEADKSFTYSIDDGPAAVASDNVNGYVGRVKVFPNTADGNAFVTWSSEWESSVGGGVAEFCDPIYHALLADLKAHFE
jgi:hypothetical protein